MTSHTTKKPRGYWTKETIIASVQQFSQRNGRAPTVREMRPENNLPWQQTVIQKFGSHNAMLIAAGLPPRQAFRKDQKKRHPSAVKTFFREQTTRQEPKRRAKWEKEEILTALRETYAKYGAMPPPHPTLPGFPSRKAIQRQFGTYTAALKAAGLSDKNLPKGTFRTYRPRIYPPGKVPGKVWDKEEALQVLRDYVQAHGALPKGNEKPEPTPYFPARSTYRRLFGSWNKAVEEAGFEPIKQGGSKPGRAYRKSDREPRPNPREFQGWAFDNRKGEKADLKERERRRTRNAV